MFIDVHTHVGTAEHVGPEFQEDLDCCWSGLRWDISLDAHRTAMDAVDAAVVLAFDAPASGIMVPNEYVAEYVSGNDRFFGFASVDPARPDAVHRLRTAVHDLGLVGLKLGPIYQGFHPQDPRAMRVFAEAERLGIPVMCHQGTTFVSRGRMAYALPHLLDDVAIAFPDLKICVAHLGHPWIAETMALIRKHKNLTADISAVGQRPWQLYTALVTAAEYGVTDKILFGSDFPFGTPETSLRSLEQVNDIVRGTSLPAVPEAAIHSISAGDALSKLGLEA